MCTLVSRLTAIVCAAALIPGAMAPAEAAPLSNPVSTPGSTPSQTVASNPFAHLPAGFDVQAHRGGRGEYTEESLAAFSHALDLKVTTLELDIALTKDGVPIIWHDRTMQQSKCRDTKPASANDPLYPYVGKPVKALTWAQISTLRCDKKLSNFPEQKAVAGNKVASLPQLFRLVRRKGASKVYFNIETKTLPYLDDDAYAQRFVDTILRESQRARVLPRVMIQSFDWRTLKMVRRQAPSVPLVMLINGTWWFPYSPMTGPVSYEQVQGDPIKAAQLLGVQVISPDYGSADKLYADAAFCSRAHRAGIRVVPYTVNSEAAMKAQIKAGADGYITDYPARGLRVARTMGKL